MFATITQTFMEPIFTLPYSEYQAIEQVSKRLKKSQGYAIYIPTSRQQKGVDFVIHNTKTNKFARVQVKGSRSYTDGDSHYLWYNNFVERYEVNNADFYFLFGLYPVFETGKKGVRKGEFWKPITLCFSEGDMFSFLKQVKTKKEQKPDKFFAFGFVTPKEIVCARGPAGYSVTKHLIDNQIEALKTFLK
jgi:hypothetical protein